MTTNTISLIEVLRERAHGVRQIVRRHPQAGFRVELSPYMLALMRLEIKNGIVERRNV